MPLTDDDKQWLKETFATKADLERVETSFAPIEQRMRAHREALRTLDIEGEQLSDVLKRVEARLKELGSDG